MPILRPSVTQPAAEKQRLGLMSEPRGLSPNGPLPTLDRRVTLHFTVPYSTVWGQNILLTGSGALLGGLQWSRARNMTCHHEKDALVWEATVVLPWKPFYTYKYALVRQALDPVLPSPMAA